MLTIVTSSKNKYLDISHALAPIPTVWLQRDLEEIQSLDPKQVIEHKLQQARLGLPNSEFLIDDRSLAVECLGGLPGTFVKYFLETLGAEGIYKITEAFENKQAQARCFVGYCSKTGELSYFLGEVDGSITSPRGTLDYGWGPIFKPKGHTKTLGEMDRSEKKLWSHYAKALEKFKNYYLEKEDSGKRGALAILLDTQGNIIAQKRDNVSGIMRPGKIGLFGGASNFQETPQSTILRELEEELELSVTSERVELFQEFSADMPIHPDSPVASSVFVVKNIEPQKLVLHEGQAIMVIPPAMLSQYDWCDECLQVVNSYLKNIL